MSFIFAGIGLWEAVGRWLMDLLLSLTTVTENSMIENKCSETAFSVRPLFLPINLASDPQQVIGLLEGTGYT
ncbi:hypothetical protein [Pseudovibrio sp. Tun.PSC04-5.I4]|uniref:hypothetical protein n=1 Tax=Pseudovibrio sp. Tun.PSC04-5.I4 TaxID=1798213 RepID=UPI0008857088|nr:hypothetical protein [Pseudovibrio sp. Tun.PSC04-5.I4]SDR09727.1 hypothetical protein SAMN04515695_2745 [Pseudovibrio sp. Tun.PSC04-5.I4]